MSNEELENFDNSRRENVYVQPEFILQAIGKQTGREKVYVVKNIPFNTRPFFVSGGIYSYRDCLVKNKVLDWIDDKVCKALCVSVINHNRNMIVSFQTIEDQVPKNFYNRVKGLLGLKQLRRAPDMPEQILVQFLGSLQNERKH